MPLPPASPDATRRAPPVSLGADSVPLLHEIGEAIELGVFTLDQDLVVRSWNRWMSAASGIDPDAVVGRPLLDQFPEVRGTAAESALRRGLDGATVVWAHQFHRFLIPLPPRPGYERFPRMQQSAQIMPIRDASLDGAMVMVRDVSERVAQEEDLHAALQRAEGASRAKSDFLASMSHELRTPLSAVIGYMDLLVGDMVGPVPENQKVYLKRVRSAAHHLISIIEEILVFARIEAGKEEAHPEALDIVALAHDVEELLEPQAFTKGLTLRVVVPDQPLIASTDATKLRQILINLVGNAVKFTDVGSVDLELAVEGDAMRFSIRDTGPGIPASHLEDIFDPFTQVDQSLKRSKGGTGLGLPVSRRLAQLLGGDLTVASKAGVGTTFTLRLPLRRALADDTLPSAN